MRRLSHLWLPICNFDNLVEASRRACRSRKNKAEVAEFLADRDEKLHALRHIMLTNQYHSSEYRFFIANDRGKNR